MMLTPSGQWQWYWEDDANCLAIRLAEELCLVTAYTEKNLRWKLHQTEDFCLSDTQVYYTSMETLQLCCPHLSNAEQVQISLNACAARKFHKPVGLKSWFFDRNSDAADISDIAEVFAESSAEVLVLEREGLSATCMILDKQLSLTSDKSLSQFSLIKIATDRLKPKTAESLQQISA